MPQLNAEDRLFVRNEFLPTIRRCDPALFSRLMTRAAARKRTVRLPDPSLDDQLQPLPEPAPPASPRRSGRRRSQAQLDEAEVARVVDEIVRDRGRVAGSWS